MTKITVKIQKGDFQRCHLCKSDDMRSKHCPTTAQEANEIDFFQMTCGSCGTRHIIDDVAYFAGLLNWSKKDTTSGECERWAK